jgi:hypothetical protein
MVYGSTGIIIGDFTDDFETPGGARSFYSGSGDVTLAGTPSMQNVIVMVPLTASPDYKTRLIVSDIPIGFTDFSKIFGIGEVEDYGTYIPLPVLMYDFKAVKVHEGVQLQWNVGVEDNVSHYAVEWSADGKKFDFIGRMNATGLKSYQYLHTMPKMGLNYYRIRTIDNDGSGVNGVIRVVQAGVNKSDMISVFPNPVGAGKKVKLIINSSSRTNALVLITDQFGRQVHTSKIAMQVGVNETFLQLNMAAGIYYVRLHSGNATLNAIPAQKIVISE